MLILLYLVLMLRVGRCTDYRLFETKIVGVGDDLKLTCPRESSATSFWIRLVSGNLPEVLGRTFKTESADPSITVSGEAGTFVLQIKNVKRSDTGIYVCFKTQQKWIFLKTVDLRVEGPESDITAVPPSDPVRPRDSATLQCSVLSDCENQTCPGDLSMCCFRVGSNESHPSLNYTQQNSAEEYENNPDGLSTKKCIFKNVNSSDAGTYYCAVDTCEEIFCRNRSKPNPEDAVALQTNAATASAVHQSQQIDEDSLVYSAPTFTSRKSRKAERRDAKTEEEESIYTDVRTCGLE
ncbi:contactin-1-like isoform X2 [Dicentrarchus labrax]|uniref:contactin-1-like isoform X2 n=1 Tax=Dicentrarchus labrax TaxID=13489 RepID=UPI0021F6720A|nr:contactin-1-like isoform X2 [Dicentrarchus labrax]